MKSLVMIFIIKTTIKKRFFFKKKKHILEKNEQAINYFNSFENISS
jgi:hypothetical protein